MSKSMTQAERITALEVEVSGLKEEQTLLRGEVRALRVDIQTLLALKERGAGAFWLMSIIFGTALVGWVSVMISWMKR